MFVPESVSNNKSFLICIRLISYPQKLLVVEDFEKNVIFYIPPVKKKNPEFNWSGSENRYGARAARQFRSKLRNAYKVHIYISFSTHARLTRGRRIITVRILDECSKISALLLKVFYGRRFLQACAWHPITLSGCLYVYVLKTVFE